LAKAAVLGCSWFCSLVVGHVVNTRPTSAAIARSSQRRRTDNPHARKTTAIAAAQKINTNELAHYWATLSVSTLCSFFHCLHIA